MTAIVTSPNTIWLNNDLIKAGESDLYGMKSERLVKIMNGSYEEVFGWEFLSFSATRNLQENILYMYDIQFLLL